MKLIFEDVRLPVGTIPASVSHAVISSGQTASLVGASHSGKSSLLLMAAGYMEPAYGRVFLMDGDIEYSRQSDRHTRHTLVGLGPIQDFSPLFDTLTVQEHIRYQVRLMKYKSSKIRTRVRELLAMYDLDDCQRMRIKDLNQFRHFKTGLAVAAAARPKFVLLDEPLKGLTEDERAAAWAYFRQLNEQDVGVLLTSVVSAAVEEADVVIRLPEGEVEYREHMDSDSGRVGPIMAQ